MNTCQKIWMIVLTIITSCAPHSQSAVPKDLVGYIDPNIKMGELSNGVKYIIWKNDFTKGKANFYTFYTVGALVEKPDEYGMCHLIEHMGFDPTPHTDSLLAHLYHTGLKLGQNINAGTSWDNTRWKAINIPTQRETLIDTLFMYLSYFPTRMKFPSAMVERQRKLVLAEWQQKEQTGDLFDKSLLPYMGESYARKNTLGDTTVIRNFTAADLKSFYDKYYGLNNLIVLAVGDFDPDSIEEKIKSHFGTAEKPRTDSPSVTIPLPVLKDRVVYIGTLTDGPNMLEIHYKLPNKPREPQAQLQNKYLNNLISFMINRRLTGMQGGSQSSFVDAHFEYSPLFFKDITYDSYTFTACTFDDLLTALVAMQTEIDRILLHGFTDEELAAAKQAYAPNDDDQDKRMLPNTELDIMLYFYLLDGYIPFSVQSEQDFKKNVLPGITLDQVNNTAKTDLTQSPPVILLTYREKQGQALPDIETVNKQLDAINSASIAPYVSISKSERTGLLEQPPVPGTIVSEKINGRMGCVEWELSNGAKVVFKRTEADAPISFSFQRNRPNAEWGREYMSLFDYSPTYFGRIGAADLSKAKLDQYTKGGLIKITPVITQTVQRLSGSCPAQDMETALQLTNVYFRDPLFDEKVLKNGIQEVKSIPDGMLIDSLHAISGNNISLFKEIDQDELAKKLPEIYRSIYDDPKNFTLFITGNVAEEQVKNGVNQYIGSLPANGSLTASVPQITGQNGLQAGEQRSRVIKYPSGTNATVYIGCQGIYESSPDCESLVSDLLVERCKAVLRNEKQLVYSVINMPLTIDRFQTGVLFSVKKENAEEAKKMALEQMKSVFEGNISEKEFNSLKNDLLEQREKDMTTNGWWVYTALPSFYLKHKDIVPNYLEEIRAFTLDDMKKIMKGIYSQGNVIDVTMMPEN